MTVCQSCGWGITDGDPCTTVGVFSPLAELVDEGTYHTTCLNALLDLRPAVVPPAEPDPTPTQLLGLEG